MDKVQPRFSRCSIGRDKWFWVVYASFRDMCDRNIHASGTAHKAVEAEEQAKAIILADLDCDCPCQDPANQARYAHHREMIKRRATRTSEATETTTTEFVYRHWTSDYDGSWHSTPHRIMKKTAKRVYVKWRHRSWEEDGQVYHDVKTIVLDRNDLETKGEAWNRRLKEFFYTSPYEEPPPRCFEFLGLKAGCNEDAVNSAYRSLAHRLHPDHSGKAEEFKRLQVAYEEALQMMKC